MKHEHKPIVIQGGSYLFGLALCLPLCSSWLTSTITIALLYFAVPAFAAKMMVMFGFRPRAEVRDLIVVAPAPYTELAVIIAEAINEETQPAPIETFVTVIKEDKMNELLEAMEADDDDE